MLHKKRCSWCLGHPDYIHYHDTERGVPLHDERKHFEMLVLRNYASRPLSMDHITTP